MKVHQQGPLRGTYLPDAALDVAYDIFLSGALTLQNPVNMPHGEPFRILLRQDGVGGHTVSFGNVLWNGSVAPTMPAAADAFMIVELVQYGNTVFGHKVSGT